MVHVLGINLPDGAFARFAFTRIFGIGPKLSHRLCARLSIHDRCRVRDLSQNQLTALASFLQSPSTSPPLPRLPLASTSYVPPPPGTPNSRLRQPKILRVQGDGVNDKPSGRSPYKDPLATLKIESELRREIRENIAHHRIIASYVGRRHAMGLPVRGQNTQSNAKTARRLNRIDRKL